MRRRRYDIRDDPAFAAFIGEDTRRKLLRLAARHPDWREEVAKIWSWYGLAYRGDKRAFAKADRALARLWEKHTKG